MPHWFISQGHAEDVILWHRYNYYVLGCGLIPDGAYDALEHSVRSQWGIGITDTLVGSSEASDYPEYIREQRRPDGGERGLRDAAIAKRWLDSL